MPPPAGTITAGEPETGLWCPACLLPSRVRTPLYLAGDHGSFLAAVSDSCAGCEEEARS